VVDAVCSGDGRQLSAPSAGLAGTHIWHASKLLLLIQIGQQGAARALGSDCLRQAMSRLQLCGPRGCDLFSVLLVWWGWVSNGAGAFCILLCSRLVLSWRKLVQDCLQHPGPWHKWTRCTSLGFFCALFKAATGNTIAWRGLQDDPSAS
jgi:hypothetical protein